MSLFLVGCGGFIGANARYFLASFLNRINPLRPFGTWIANITGSILLAALFVAFSNGTLSSSMWLLLGTGFCGAYTTFSTFGTELVTMIMAKDYQRATIYSVTSDGISLVAVTIVFLIY